MTHSITPPPDEHITPESYRHLLARYERLMEISQQLNSTLDLGALLQRIIHAATELTGTQEASILLMDPSSGQLRFEASSNLSRAEMEAIPVPLDRSLAGWVVTHDEPVLVEDARSDERWFPRVDKTTQIVTRNLLAVPMTLQNKPIGVVEAINKRDDKPWTQDDVNSLAMLANQAAIAIQNARLFQQSDFIAEMVHELRTPLAALKASTALLLRPTLSDTTRREIIETMQSETERLTTLTNDFLDLARLESGRTRLDIETFDVRELLEECVNLVAHRATERAITINVGGLYRTTEADRSKIKQVMLNLLTNAVKYNREGGAITCAVTLDIPDNETHAAENILVSVQDTGMGIRVEDQNHLFEKFFRVPAASGDIPGTGLGLVIARRIIEMHGCDLWLTSEIDKGTTFYFTLPGSRVLPEH